MPTGASSSSSSCAPSTSNAPQVPLNPYGFHFHQLLQELVHIDDAFQCDAPSPHLQNYEPMSSQSDNGINTQTFVNNRWKFILFFITQKKGAPLTKDEKETYQTILNSLTLEEYPLWESFNASFHQYINSFHNYLFYKSIDAKLMRTGIKSDVSYLIELKEITDAWEQKANANCLAFLSEIDLFLGIDISTK